MVLEIATIDVKPGSEDDFVAAYAKARELLVTTEGCRRATMNRGVENPSRFVLIVEWDSVEAHIENFRASDRFPQWRGLIGPYFDGAPQVEHVAEVVV